MWSVILGVLGNEFGSTDNVVNLVDEDAPVTEVIIDDGGDTQWCLAYNQYYHSINVIYKRVQPYLTPGRVVSSADHICDQDLLKSEYYQDFLRRRDIHYLMGVVVSATPTSRALLSLGRSRRFDAWTAAERDSLGFLRPHLQRAARLNSRFWEIREERDAILNRLPMGIIVLNESGTVKYANHAAEDIVRKKDGLYITPNGISAMVPGQSSKLRAMISGARSIANGEGVAGGGSLSISRSSSDRPLSVLVAPLMPTPVWALSQVPLVALYITDPDAVQPTSLERLASMFELTPAESRLAAQLLSGKSLGNAADELGITSETARVHLKRIFSKTNTCRQSELMRLLLSSPAALRD